MNKFNLKKIDSRKKTIFQNDNFIYNMERFNNDKLKFLKKKPKNLL